MTFCHAPEDRTPRIASVPRPEPASQAGLLVGVAHWYTEGKGKGERPLPQYLGALAYTVLLREISLGSWLRLVA